MTRFAVKEPKVLVSLQSSLKSKTAGTFIMFVLKGAELVNVRRKKKYFFMLFHLCLHEKRPARYSEANRLDKSCPFPAGRLSGHFSEESHTWDRTLYFSAPYLHVA